MLKFEADAGRILIYCDLQKLWDSTWSQTQNLKWVFLKKLNFEAKKYGKSIIVRLYGMIVK